MRKSFSTTFHKSPSHPHSPTLDGANNSQRLEGDKKNNEVNYGEKGI
jgi:hypothetical protein